MSWHRRRYRGRDLARVLSIEDLRLMAMRRVPNFVFEYLEGGAEDEQALRHNRDVFQGLYLQPQTLVDTSRRSLRTTLFGRESAAPIALAPTGGNGVLEANGDLKLARAAAAAGIAFTSSTVATVRLESLAQEVGGRLWMQLYLMDNRKIAEDIVRRADTCGFEVLMLTTDANIFGQREWDRRNYARPGKPTARNILSVLTHPRWAYEVLLRSGAPKFQNFADFLPANAINAVGGSMILPKLFDTPISWADVEWLRRLWPRKLVIKGVLSVADAERAAAAGCDGIVLTNHGGRQLDHCVSALDVLPEIAQHMGERLTILVDGGFRRGTDVIKALCLGAHCVLLGRATLYGLGAAGQAGAARALEIITSEMDRCLGHLGCNSIAELGPRFLRRG
jgi:(S)-mandelate dehydrogenase